MENKWNVVIWLILILIITGGFIWLYYDIKLPEEPKGELPEVKLSIPEIDSTIYFKCNLTDDAYKHDSRNYFLKDDILLNCYSWYKSESHELLVLKIETKIFPPSRKFWLFNTDVSQGYATIFKENEIKTLELIRYKDSINLNETGYYTGKLTIEIYNITRDEIKNKLPFYTGNETDFPVKHYDIPKKYYPEKSYSFRVYSLEELDNIKMTSQ